MNRMKNFLLLRKVIPLIFVVALVFLVSCGQKEPQTQTNTTQEESPQPILLDSPWPPSEFVLTDQHGNQVNASDFSGKFILLYFGFTNCPDQCPTTLGFWKTVHTQLGSKAEQVEFIMITVDPERDTTERLKEYMSFFDEDFIGLTGTLPEIQDVAEDYRISFRKEPLESDPEGYQVVHTTQSFLIDKDGQVIVVFPYNTGPTELLETIEKVLN